MGKICFNCLYRGTCSYALVLHPESPKDCEYYEDKMGGHTIANNKNGKN